VSRSYLSFPALAAIMVATSCRLTPAAAPVPVEGNRDELAAVSGDWSGRYWSKATGRHGIIRFSLRENADTAFGEVEITFSPALEAARHASAVDGNKNLPAEDLQPEACTTIALTVVRVEQDGVRGTMAPYWDPDCECRAHTVFEGTISGDSITGTFSSRRESSDRRLLTGQWRVDREQS
jgi:hypothetical protein